MTDNDQLDNLVDRLRDADRAYRVTHQADGSLWNDAADAIEALSVFNRSLLISLGEELAESKNPELFPLWIRKRLGLVVDKIDTSRGLHPCQIEGADDD